MEVTTWTRQALCLLTVLLAILGNTPRHVVNAQQGTTKRVTTLFPKATTGINGAGGLQKTTLVGVVGGTQNTLPATNGRGVTVTGVTPVGPSGQATTVRANPNPSGGGGPVLTTQRSAAIVTNRVSQAQTTRFAAVVTTSSSLSEELMFDYAYQLSESSNGIGPYESICASNSKNDLAVRLGISPLRLVNVKCSAAGSGNPNVLVRGSITEGSKPTVQDMDNFKITTNLTTLFFKGARGSNVALVRGSFDYSRREEQASSGKEGLILGLSETHWVLIGMGTVIILLFAISIGVILTSRRFGPKKKRRLDEEASTASTNEAEEKPKKKWFGFMNRKKKDDSDSDSDESDSGSSSGSDDGSVKSDRSDDSIEEEKKKKKKGFGLFKKKDKNGGSNASLDTKTDVESAYESTKDGDAYDQLPNDQSSNIPEEHKIF